MINVSAAPMNTDSVEQKSRGDVDGEIRGRSPTARAVRSRLLGNDHDVSPRVLARSGL
jgi:hypothetical protein